MKLTSDQVLFYKENGYLQIHNYLNEREIKILTDELPNTIEIGSPRIILEDNGSVRSIFAPHFNNSVYKRLVSLERFVIPSRQLIGSGVYLHQYKINTKKGLKGEWWEWHQDFPFWHIDDGIRAPDMVTVMIYLQDTNALNGALLVIPKSHQLGIVKFEDKNSGIYEEQAKNKNVEANDYLSSLNADIKFTVNHDVLKRLATENGIVDTSGKRGTVLFFHGNIFHASNTNLTPFDRDAILITYNGINNIPGNTIKPRPEFLAGRNYQAIENTEISL
jgi:ectoine hydroxylase